jgi:hypothetical protein
MLPADVRSRFRKRCIPSDARTAGARETNEAVFPVACQSKQRLDISRLNTLTSAARGTIGEAKTAS